MRRTGWLIVWSILACGESEPEGLSVPDLGTEYLLYGTAVAGRSLPASGVRIARVDDVGPLRPDPISDRDVDLLVAGLSNEDLPDGLRWDDLAVVNVNADDARPIPQLRTPHVLNAPGPASTPTNLVPVNGIGVPNRVATERAERLRLLTTELAIAAPCRPLAVAMDVVTPQIPGEAILRMQTLSTGTIMMGMSTTSTSVVALLDPGATDVRLQAVPTGTVTAVLPGQRAFVEWFDTQEVQHEGAPWPAMLTMDVAGGFAEAGLLWVYDETRQRYVDRTPRPADTVVRTLNGARRIDFGSGPEVCVFGGLDSPFRESGLWCAPQSTLNWRLEHIEAGAFSFTQMLTPSSGPPIALDLAGSVFEYGGPGRWTKRFESILNSGCEPLCAPFRTTLSLASGDRLGIMSGTKAQFLVIAQNQGNLTVDTLEALTASLYFDERVDAEEGLQFSALTVAPDGALWIGTTAPNLFRLAPDGQQIDRVCLPRQIRDSAISSIEATADGRLVVGMAPALLGFSDWRW